MGQQQRLFLEVHGSSKERMGRACVWMEVTERDETGDGVAALLGRTYFTFLTAPPPPNNPTPNPPPPPPSPKLVLGSRERMLKCVYRFRPLESVMLYSCVFHYMMKFTMCS